MVALTVVLYWPARTYGFSNFDDVLHVVQNPYLQPLEAKRLAYFWRYPFDPSPVEGVAAPILGLRLPYQSIYTPLSFTLHAVTASFAHENGGLNAGVFHIVNIALHALNGVLCFLLLLRLTRSRWGAFLGALLFAGHPMQAEAVVWVTGQNGLLAESLVFLAALAYLRPLRHVEDEEEVERSPAGWYLLSLVLFTLALLAKPSAVMLPPVLLVLEWAFFPRPWASRAKALAPFFALSLLCAIINSSLHRNDPSGVAVVPWLRGFLMGDSWTFYLAKLIWPIGLVLDYGRRPDIVLSQWWSYLAWLVPAGLALSLWRTRGAVAISGEAAQLWRGLAAGLAYFLLMLLPTSGLIPYYFHTYSTVADRYIYAAMPGAGLALAAAGRWALAALNGRPALRKNTPWLLPASLVAASMVLTPPQVSYWASDLSLWSHVLEYNDHSWIANLSIGRLLLEDGAPELALEKLERAKELNPTSSDIRLRLGDALVAAGRDAEAETEYRAGLKLAPGLAYGCMQLGVLLVKENKLPEAVDLLETVRQQAPGNPTVLGNLGLALMKLGHGEDGEKLMQDALKRGFDPAKGNFYLGVSEAMRGEYVAAADSLQASVLKNPKDFDAQFNLGLALQKTGQLPVAEKAFETALALRPYSAKVTRELSEIRAQIALTRLPKQPSPSGRLR